MKIKFYGTRGSVPVANPHCVNYGGNTTCIRVYSDCIPGDTAMVIDGGTGFVPLGYDILKEGGCKDILMLFTHYHHDHTQGLFLSPVLFIKNIKMQLYGPIDDGIGPKKMLEELMRPPYFPVHFKEVSSHINCTNLEFPKTLIILIHPKGYKLMNIDEYERTIKENKFIPIGRGKYPVEEFLVITMYKSRHPGHTISYRLEEKSTGKTFVYLTDHENEDGIPASLKGHLKDVDLLVMDSQYSREKYEKITAGYGHGTPDYCIRVAETVNAHKLGLTHHDPNSTDKDIEGIVEEAKKYSKDHKIEIFACADYQVVEV